MNLFKNHAEMSNTITSTYAATAVNMTPEFAALMRDMVSFIEPEMMREVMDSHARYVEYHREFTAAMEAKHPEMVEFIELNARALASIEQPVIGLDIFKEAQIEYNKVSHENHVRNYELFKTIF